MVHHPKKHCHVKVVTGLRICTLQIVCRQFVPWLLVTACRSGVERPLVRYSLKYSCTLCVNDLFFAAAPAVNIDVIPGMRMHSE